MAFVCLKFAMICLARKLLDNMLCIIVVIELLEQVFSD